MGQLDDWKLLLTNDMYSVAEVAYIASLSITGVMRRIRNNTFDGKQDKSKKWHIYKASVIEYLEEHPSSLRLFIDKQPTIREKKITDTLRALKEYYRLQYVSEANILKKIYDIRPEEILEEIGIVREEFAKVICTDDKVDLKRIMIRDKRIHEMELFLLNFKNIVLPHIENTLKDIEKVALVKDTVRQTLDLKKDITHTVEYFTFLTIAMEERETMKKKDPNMAETISRCIDVIESSYQKIEEDYANIADLDDLCKFRSSNDQETDDLSILSDFIENIYNDSRNNPSQSDTVMQNNLLLILRCYTTALLIKYGYMPGILGHEKKDYNDYITDAQKKNLKYTAFLWEQISESVYTSDTEYQK